MNNKYQKYKASKLTVVVEALITLTVTPTMITTVAIGLQGLVLPGHIVMIPKAEILTQPNKPMVWKKYEYFIADSTTDNVSKNIFILFTSLILLFATNSIASRTYFRIVIFLIEVFKRNHN